MNWATIAKYTTGTALAGSVFFLVMTGKVDANTYLQIVVSPGLAALGYHVASNRGNGTVQPPAPPLVADKPAA